MVTNKVPTEHVKTLLHLLLYPNLKIMLTKAQSSLLERSNKCLDLKGHFMLDLKIIQYTFLKK